MTRLILCSGKTAAVPYHFKLTGVNVYSIEELCYYIHQNIYMVNTEMFTLELANFMERELGLKDRAGKLRELIRVRADLKDLVVCIMCSCDYYTEPEIKDIIHVVDEISDLSQLKRNKLLADQCLTYKNYAEAKRMYEAILTGTESKDLEEKEYGNILHNLGIIELHTTGFQEACRLFGEAYEHNHNMESLHQYLFALRIISEDTVYEKELNRFTNGVAMDHMIREEIATMNDKISLTKEYKVVKAMEQLHKEGRTALYQREVKQQLASWKEEYRRQNALQEG